MKQPEDVFRDLIHGIAEENNYNNYTTTVRPISSGGANFSSYLLLATVSAPDKDDLHLFAKVAALGEKIRNEVGSSGGYTSEQYFYKDILPMFRRIEEKYEVPAQRRFVSAKFYGSSQEYLYETLVLENLSVKGFESFDRFQSIDWAYASFSVKQLARFHALSIAYIKEFPTEYEKVKAEFIEYPGDMLNDPLQKAIDKAIKIVEGDNKKKLIEFLGKDENKKPTEILFQKLNFPVLRHGDYRPSNMMHKVLMDGSVEAIPLDYQTIGEGLPVTDLLYFVLTGSDKKFRKQYLQKTFDLYYTELSSTLRLFQLRPEEIYSQQTYEQDIKTLLPHMLTLSFLMLLLVTVDEDDAPTVNKDFDMDSLDIKPSPLYIERVNDLVDDIIAMGLL